MSVQLREDQQRAVDHLVGRLSEYNAVLDASDTGVGKTYTACGIAQRLNRTPLIICPKAVRSSWRRVAEAFELPILDVVNIEKLKTGNTKWLNRKSKKVFSFNLPKNSMVIWDEAQMAGGVNSENQVVMALLKAYKIPVLMASATLADSPLRLRAPGFLLGMHDYNMQSYKRFCLDHGCFVDPRYNQWRFMQGKSRTKFLEKINEHIFPDRGYRIRLKELEDIFPDGIIQADAYDVQDHTEEIQKIYDEMDERLRLPRANPLSEMMRARQATELLKIPVTMELAYEFLEEGKSVVIFVSFNETIVQMMQKAPKEYGEPAIIWGRQSDFEREKAIQDFFNDKKRLCFAMIQAGGVGINLHDTYGKYPRVSLITPPYSAVQLHQALGRIHRAGSKTPTLQKIVFAAGTIEEKACQAVRKKLDNISMINDGDLFDGIVDYQEELKL